jgi:hypothetical protein
MSVHKTNHMTMQDAVIRKVLDDQAAKHVADIDEVAGRIITRDAIFDTVRTKAFERLLNDEMEISVKDTLDVLDRIDAAQKNEHQVRLDGMISDLNVLTRIIQQEVPQDKWAIIATRWHAERGVTPTQAPKPKSKPKPKKVIEPKKD